MANSNLRRYTTTIQLVCDTCGETFDAIPGAVNRATKLGTKVRFCSRPCAGLARRAPPVPIDEKRRKKSAYDAAHRAAKAAEIRAKKNAAYLANHAERLRQMAEKRADPVYREKMRAYQREHSARPEWKAHKKTYDRRFKAEKKYGPEWAEAAIALWELEDAISEKMPTRQERYAAKGTLNKSQARKRNGTSKAQRNRAQGHPVDRHGGRP